MALYQSQAQLVSSAFEEGHFEIGIAALDNLRSEHYKPTQAHLLQLFFISLNPATGSTIMKNVDDVPSFALDPNGSSSNVLLSPRKVAKMARSTTALTPNAVNAARKLLLSFTLTNSPETLALPLPRCLGPGELAPTIGDGDWDSTPIYNQSIGILSAKSCWEILKDGYVAEQNRLALLASPSKKSKMKGTRSRPTNAPRQSLFPAGEDSDGSDEGETAPVGPNAWFFLEWLVRLFQKDADEQESKEKQRYSPLLIQQLPVPRDGKLERWDTLEPLKIIFFALQQENPRKKQIGVELLILLVEASYTPYLSSVAFTGSVCSEILSSPSSPDCSTDPLQDLLSRLPHTPSVTPFKAALCKKFLHTLVQNQPSSDDPSDGTSTSRPQPIKPQPKRVAPRPTPINKLSVAASSASIDSSAHTTPPTKTASKPTGPSLLIPIDQVFDLLRLKVEAPAPRTRGRRQTKQHPDDHRPSWITDALVMRVKYELVLSCALVLTAKAQENLAASTPTANGEQSSGNATASTAPGRPSAAQPAVEGWLRAIRDGTITKVLDEVFSNDGDGVLYKMLLESALGGASSFNCNQ